MVKLKTFNRGGVHPQELKLTAGVSIIPLEVPNQVMIPSQSLGSFSVPIVQKGDIVKIGQLIAKGESFISSNIHSSVSGKVNKIDNVVDVSGYKNLLLLLM